MGDQYDIAFPSACATSGVLRTHRQTWEEAITPKINKLKELVDFPEFWQEAALLETFRKNGMNQFRGMTFFKRLIEVCKLNDQLDDLRVKDIIEGFFKLFGEPQNYYGECEVEVPCQEAVVVCLKRTQAGCSLLSSLSYAILKSAEQLLGMMSLGHFASQCTGFLANISRLRVLGGEFLSKLIEIYNILADIAPILPARDATPPYLSKLPVSLTFELQNDLPKVYGICSEHPDSWETRTAMAREAFRVAKRPVSRSKALSTSGLKMPGLGQALNKRSVPGLTLMDMMRVGGHGVAFNAQKRNNGIVMGVDRTPDKPGDHTLSESRCTEKRRRDGLGDDAIDQMDVIDGNDQPDVPVSRMEEKRKKAVDKRKKRERKQESCKAKPSGPTLVSSPRILPKDPTPNNRKDPNTINLTAASLRRCLMSLKGGVLGNPSESGPPTETGVTSKMEKLNIRSTLGGSAVESTRPVQDVREGGKSQLNEVENGKGLEQVAEGRDEAGPCLQAVEKRVRLDESVTESQVIEDAGVPENPACANDTAFVRIGQIKSRSGGSVGKLNGILKNVEETGRKLPDKQVDDCFELLKTKQSVWMKRRRKWDGWFQKIDAPVTTSVFGLQKKKRRRKHI